MVCNFIALLVSLGLFLWEVTGAIYLRQKIKNIVNDTKTNFLMKLWLLLNLMAANINYLYYLLTTILLLLGLANPFFDSVLLIIELFKRN